MERWVTDLPFVFFPISHTFLINFELDRPPAFSKYAHRLFCRQTWADSAPRLLVEQAQRWASSAPAQERLQPPWTHSPCQAPTLTFDFSQSGNGLRLRTCLQNATHGYPKLSSQQYPLSYIYIFTTWHSTVKNNRIYVIITNFSLLHNSIYRASPSNAVRSSVTHLQKKKLRQHIWNSI